MIRQVEVVNWKAFDRREIDFGEGLNLLIGRNASGKSTILDGISLALVGEALEAPRFRYLIRDRTKPSTISLRLSIDGKRVSIRRSFTIERMGGAWVSENGKEEGVTWDEATHRVEQLLGAGREFLRRIAYISEGAVFRYLQDPPSDALTNQIERIFGIDRLQEYLNDLKEMRSAVSDEISETEETIGSVEIPPDLPARLNLLASKLGVLDQDIQAKRHEIQILVREVTDLERTKEMRERVMGLLDILVSIARANGLTVLDSVSMESLGKSIVDMLSVAHKQVIQRLDGAKAQSSSITARLAYLDDLEKIARESEKTLRTKPVGQQCPVCKRPLEETHVKRILSEIVEERAGLREASAKIANDVSALGKESGDLERRRVEAERVITELLAYARQLKVKTIAQLRSVFEGIDKRLTEAQTKQGKAEKDVEALEKEAKTLANERAGLEAAKKQAEQLATFRTKQVRLSASELVAEMTAGAISDAVEKERKTNISAIQANLSHLWNRFRGGQERIEFRPDGEIIVIRNRDRLSFHQLSGGEKTVLLVLSHTIAARALSNLDFLMIDEPLEHLDLENRRSLLNFLVQASKRRFLSQMIVSTFEESLTRRYLDDPLVRPIYL